MTIEFIKRTTRTRYLHSVAKLSAKENHTAKLVLTACGGTFRVTQELIAFLSIEQLGVDTIILDIYDNPIKVDREKLLADAVSTYNTVMESWLSTVDKINNQR